MILTKWKFGLLYLAGILLTFSACDNSDPDDNINPDMGPEILPCGYFSEGLDRTLINDPDKPVDYLVECWDEVTVNLTIQAGTVIAFAENAGLDINDNTLSSQGTLRVNGTATNPVVLKGNVSNAGSWRGVYIYSSSTQNKLNYCNIQDGGGEPFSSNGESANLVISGRANISNCSFTNSADYGVEIRDGANYTFENNSMQNNNIPFTAWGADATEIGEGNDFTNNTNDYVLIGAGDMFNTGDPSSKTLLALNVPYRVEQRTIQSPTLTVNQGKSLTIEAGAVLEFESGTGLYANEGALVCNGTVANRIVLRGANSGAGAWGSVYYSITTANSNSVTYTDIIGAGEGSAEGGIELWGDPAVTIDHCNFSNINGCGIYSYTQNPSNFTEGTNNTYSNVSGGNYCE